MNDCEKYSALIELLHDEELEPGKTAGVAAHIEQCSRCAQQLRLLGAVRGAIRATLREVQAEGESLPIISAVLARLQAEGISQISQIDKLRLWFSDALALYKPYMVTAAVAAVVAAVVAVLVTRSSPAEKNFCAVQAIEFENANAMVYKTQKNNMTVIWVTEQLPEKPETGERI